MSGMQGGPGGSSALPFMSFDLGSVSAPPPRVSASYSGGGGGFGAFEDEAPLLEGEFPSFAKSIHQLSCPDSSFFKPCYSAIIEASSMFFRIAFNRFVSLL
jgi:hypothetical protein